jgi:hypothetical protein
LLYCSKVCCKCLVCKQHYQVCWFLMNETGVCEACWIARQFCSLFSASWYTCSLSGPSLRSALFWDSMRRCVAPLPHDAV